MSQKIENQLNLALDATEAERQRSRSLNVGYDEEENEWELILKYSGSLEPVRELAVYVTELTGGYVIIQIKESRIEELAALPEVEFIEKPKNLYFQVENGRRVSCIDEVQAASSFFSAGQDIGKESGEAGDGADMSQGMEQENKETRTDIFPLLGKGVLLGIVDSGIDYENPDFRNADGTTRIAALWDQTVETGLPPAGYNVGTEFTSQQINAALQTAGHEERFRLVPSRDISGHGTAVAGIAAGVVGTLMLIARLFDGVSDLFMGVIIDKTNTRWGKARPWVLWSAPPLVVSLIMIFTVPNIGANGKAIYMLLVYIFLAAVCFTASNLSYNTMLSLVTTEQHDRNVMNTIRFEFTMIAQLVINVITIPLVHFLGNGQKGWTCMSIIYAIVALGMFITTFAGTKERYKPIKPEVTEKKKKHPIKTIKILCSNKYFILITLAFAIIYT